MLKKLSVIIPAYNEEKTISEVISSVKSLPLDLVNEIIMVDDGSIDKTAEIAQKEGARVISHKRNMGYGASLKTGIRNTDAEYVLIMDADSQHKCEDIHRLWIKAKDYDMVVGQRTNLLHSPLWRLPGKILLNLIANYLTQYKIPDLNSGFRIIKRDIALRYLHLCPQGFSFSTTITMTLLNRGYDVAFVPITAEKRKGKSTVKISTGFDTLILILRIATLFNPLRLFVPLSLMVALIGLAWGIPYVLQGRGISIGALLAFLTSVLLFTLGLLCDQIAQLRLEKFE